MPTLTHRRESGFEWIVPAAQNGVDWIAGGRSISRRVAVHHFVANLTTRQHGPHPTSDLLGVDYVYEVPPDTEFPRFVPRIDLFTRFYLRNAPPCEFFVRVWWLDAPRRRRGQMTGEHGPFTVPFPVNALVYDHVFRIANLRLSGLGVYALRLVRYHRNQWDPKRAGLLAQTHFRVER
ncbi:MAG: hypothetical protein K2V38_13930 [Gemmataceae bacterium]|nr:hypothetical protein [Gemmataceae bacterium]